MRRAPKMLLPWKISRSGLVSAISETKSHPKVRVFFLFVLQEVVRQKVRRQLTKQQKAAQRRRLQKGEANLVTKSRRENQNTIKSSIEGASFWGWMELPYWMTFLRIAFFAIILDKSSNNSGIQHHHGTRTWILFCWTASTFWFFTYSILTRLYDWK